MVSSGPEKLRVEEQERKELWLKYLAEFIVEANQNTYAADKGHVEPERKGFKELEYIRHPWRLRDSYTKYFRAPGMTSVYYLDAPEPDWTMSYGGTGMIEGRYDLVKPTYKFLKEALMRVSPELPYRGPEFYKDAEWLYLFKLEPGSDLADFRWNEYIYNLDKGVLAFTQTGFGGLAIGKIKGPNERVKPVYPWNL